MLAIMRLTTHSTADVKRFFPSPCALPRKTTHLQRPQIKRLLFGTHWCPNSTYTRLMLRQLINKSTVPTAYLNVHFYLRVFLR